VVNCGDSILSELIQTVIRSVKRKAKTEAIEGTTVRATISFPSEVYQTLEGIARQKKVSLAWVVREASEQYIAEKWPLFGRGEGV
jgi:predicted DNA-binding ribbon-helix-helix protein